MGGIQDLIAHSSLNLNHINLLPISLLDISILLSLGLYPHTSTSYMALDVFLGACINVYWKCLQFFWQHWQSRVLLNDKTMSSSRCFLWGPRYAPSTRRRLVWNLLLRFTFVFFVVRICLSQQYLVLVVVSFVRRGRGRGREICNELMHMFFLCACTYRSLYYAHTSTDR